MSSNPKISVILPTYNRAHLLPQAIDSVLNQTYKNTEILVIDDHSEDNTREIVFSLQKRYQNIFYFKNEHRKGVSGARNTGLEKATGDFITFLDSDDLWMKHHLQESAEILTKYPAADMLFRAYTIYDLADNKELDKVTLSQKTARKFRGKRIGHELYHFIGRELFNYFIGTHKNEFCIVTVVLRKKLIKQIRFDERLSISEDTDFFTRLCLIKKPSIYCLNIPSATIRLHSYNTLSGQKDIAVLINRLRCHIYALNKYLQDKESLGLSKKDMRRIKKELAIRYAKLSFQIFKERRFKESFSTYLKSYHFFPDISLKIEIFEALKMIVFFLTPREYFKRLQDIKRTLLKKSF